MTDLPLATSPLSSALAALLASEFPKSELSGYRGVLTPAQLDAPQTETATLLSGAAVHDLGWRRRVEVKGEDRFRWLSGMITNVVNDLPENSGAWNLVLNAQGRIQGDLTVWRSADSVEIELDADQYDKLLTHLDRFIIMDDVELAAIDPASFTAIGVSGPAASDLLESMGIPALPEAMTQGERSWDGMNLLLRRDFSVLADHYELWIDAAHSAALWQALIAAGAQPVGWKALDALRVAEGIPAYGIDIAERDLPQETSQMRALHFSKGCYQGQEIVERIRSRGNVHRHLRSLELSGPVPAAGIELLLEGNPQPAGQITSAAELATSDGVRRFALAMLRAETETSSAHLTYRVGEVQGTARRIDGPVHL